jgi:glycosyltransferase involved in cell wall biosynthesis
MVSSVPRVSIGMPLYNAERYMREAIDSILAQTFSDFELIISDNASTDRTQEIALEYVAKDPRVRYCRNDRNRGAAYNYNRVIELARGEYFRHAAYDDILAPTNIERCVEELDRCPECALAYPRMTTIDAQGRPLKQFQDSLDIRLPTPHERYRRFNRLCDPGKMCDPVFGLFRMSVLRRTKMIQPFASADVFLLLETALRGEIHEIPEYLFFERWHDQGSVLSNQTFESRAAWFDTEKKGKWWIYLPHWRWVIEHIRSIFRLEASLIEKLMCCTDLYYVLWENKRGLLTDLTALFEHLMHPSKPVSVAGRL